jgi:hypothetical protein
MDSIAPPSWTAYTPPTGKARYNAAALERHDAAQRELYDFTYSGNAENAKQEAVSREAKRHARYNAALPSAGAGLARAGRREIAELSARGAGEPTETKEELLKRIRINEMQARKLEKLKALRGDFYANAYLNVLEKEGVAAADEYLYQQLFQAVGTEKANFIVANKYHGGSRSKKSRKASRKTQKRSKSKSRKNRKN